MQPLFYLAALNVVPTHVGVFRLDAPHSLAAWGCPHTRGGVPMTNSLLDTAL